MSGKSEKRYTLRVLGLERYFDPATRTSVLRGDAPDFSEDEVDAQVKKACDGGTPVFKEEVKT